MVNEADDITLHEKGELYVKLNLIKFMQEINNTRHFLDKLVNQIDSAVVKQTGERLERRNNHPYGRRITDNQQSGGE